MRSSLKSLIACFLGLICLSSQSKAALTLVWSSEIGLQSYKSDGSSVLDSTFSVEVGVFDAGFAPSETNVFEWVENWNVIDTTPYNAADQAFGGITGVADNNLAPIGSQIFIWIKDGDDAGSQWFLATNDNADEITTNNWTMPNVADANQTTRPLILDLNTDTVQLLTVPFGASRGDTGAGAVTGNPPSGFAIQTYSNPIPEPSAAVLLLGLAFTGLGRRRLR
jgi:hypothetical protein